MAIKNTIGWILMISGFLFMAIVIFTPIYELLEQGAIVFLICLIVGMILIKMPGLSRDLDRINAHKDNIKRTNKELDRYKRRLDGDYSQ